VTTLPWPRRDLRRYLNATGAARVTPMPEQIPMVVTSGEYCYLRGSTVTW